MVERFGQCRNPPPPKVNLQLVKIWKIYSTQLKHYTGDYIWNKKVKISVIKTGCEHKLSRTYNCLNNKYLAFSKCKYSSMYKPPKKNLAKRPLAKGLIIRILQYFMKVDRIIFLPSAVPPHTGMQRLESCSEKLYLWVPWHHAVQS